MEKSTRLDATLTGRDVFSQNPGTTKEMQKLETLWDPDLLVWGSIGFSFVWSLLLFALFASTLSKTTLVLVSPVHFRRECLITDIFKPLLSTSLICESCYDSVLFEKYRDEEMLENNCSLKEKQRTFLARHCARNSLPTLAFHLCQTWF